MWLSSLPLTGTMSSVSEDIHTSILSLVVFFKSLSISSTGILLNISPLSLNFQLTSTSSGACLSIFPTVTLYSTVLSSTAPFTLRLKLTEAFSLNSIVALLLFLFHVMVYLSLSFSEFFRDNSALLLVPVIVATTSPFVFSNVLYSMSAE